MTSIQYSLLNNAFHLSSGIDYTSNGKNADQALNLYGFKIGFIWEIIDNLSLTLNSSIRFKNNRNNVYDQSSNTEVYLVGGSMFIPKTQEKSKGISINSSGMNLSLGYKF